MKRVAIVGAGITGITLAHQLIQAGHHVDLFENGPEIPYPHTPQFEAEILYANPFAPPVELFPPEFPNGIKGLVQSGAYRRTLDDERIMCVGGQATRWFGIAPRLHREHFMPRSLYGFGADWPVRYEELEPYYCRAEAYLGISGSNDDNPFAPPRSQPYPLPPFELGYTDLILAGRLKAHGITTHTTPQARTRIDHDDRPGCQNYGVCETCPIGTRYSPNHHLDRLRQSGLLQLHGNSLVRRVIVEKGRATGVAYHPDHGDRQIELGADAVIIAAGAIESARLLLLSSEHGGHRDGLGNASGQVGRNLSMHHIWWGDMTFAEPMLPGRAGPPTLLSHQFATSLRDAGGMSVELFDSFPERLIQRAERRAARNGPDAIAALRPVISTRTITMNAETAPGADKVMALAGVKDRFGDPFAAVTYGLNDFDERTYARAARIAERITEAAGAAELKLPPIEQFWSGHHHVGTCRMGTDPRDSVTDSFGAVHDVAGLYIGGSALFPTVTPLQPTLTMVALAMRTAERLSEQL